MYLAVITTEPETFEYQTPTTCAGGLVQNFALFKRP
jgi:hypothetical protein